jgi:hypothetical protein
MKDTIIRKVELIDCGFVAVFGDRWSGSGRNSTYRFFHVGTAVVDGDDLIVTGPFGESDPQQHFDAVMDTIYGVEYVSGRLRTENGGFAASGPEGAEEMRKISSGERKLGPLDRVSKQWEGGAGGEYCYYLHTGISNGKVPNDIFKLWEPCSFRYPGRASELRQADAQGWKAAPAPLQ